MRRANEVTEPQLSRIKNRITLFVSHTSRDDGVIKAGRFWTSGSIYEVIWREFPDPFYHSFITGGAKSYEPTVGLALISAPCVLIIWSQNAVRSDYVMAELSIATSSSKRVAVYVLLVTVQGVRTNRREIKTLETCRKIWLLNNALLPDVDWDAQTSQGFHYTPFFVILFKPVQFSLGKFGSPCNITVQPVVPKGGDTDSHQITNKVMES